MNPSSLSPDEVALERFRSGEWYCDTKTGTIYRKVTGALVDGYRIIGASRRDGTRKKAGVMVHRAVWIAANNRLPPAGMQIDHLDGNKLNNSISNLNPCTDCQNKNNPATKWRKYGELNSNAKLTNDDVLDIRKRLETVEGANTTTRNRLMRQLAAEYRVSVTHIRRIANGERSVLMLPPEVDA